MNKIFNNLRIAQEVEEKVEAKTYDQLLNEMRQYAVSPEALKAGYRSLVFKYHPDRNNSSPIANENLIQLEKVYGRLRASIQSNLSNYAKRVYFIEYTDDFDMDEDQIIEKYIDFLKYTRYWRTVGEPGKEAPVRTSYTEADLHGIIEGILEYASEQDEDIIEVKIDLYYDDHNGNEKMVGGIGHYREALIEEYEERTKY